MPTLTMEGREFHSLLLILLPSMGMAGKARAILSSRKKLRVKKLPFRCRRWLNIADWGWEGEVGGVLEQRFDGSIAK